MKKTIKKLTFLGIIATSVFTGCKKDKDEVPTPPPIVNEGEVITTFKLTFVDSAGLAPTVTAQYRDPDGDGGNDAVQFDTINLLPNTTYFASVLILDETKSPADTISNEIEEEANDHLFIYTPASADVTVTITDVDTNTPTPLPLGLQTKWKTMAASTGTVQIVLRHQPDVKDGTYAPGETDIDLTFQVVIQ
jgi:hypothetical protein